MTVVRSYDTLRCLRVICISRAESLRVNVYIFVFFLNNEQHCGELVLECIFILYTNLHGVVCHKTEKCHLTLMRLMSYIYGAPILDVSRSHTTTQHSR